MDISRAVSCSRTYNSDVKYCPQFRGTLFLCVSTHWEARHWDLPTIKVYPQHSWHRQLCPNYQASPLLGEAPLGSLPPGVPKPSSRRPCPLQSATVLVSNILPSRAIKSEDVSTSGMTWLIGREQDIHHGNWSQMQTYSL